jgi:UrcA family protein
MNTARKTFATIVLTGVAALASASAFASEVAIERRVVSFADLNLTHPAGIRALYSRIRGASRSVCAAAIGRDPLYGSVRRECARESLAEAVKTLDNHALTAYVQRRINGAQERIASR